MTGYCCTEFKAKCVLENLEDKRNEIVNALDQRFPDISAESSYCNSIIEILAYDEFDRFSPQQVATFSQWFEDQGDGSRNEIILRMF